MPALNCSGLIEISDSDTIPALDELMYAPPLSRDYSPYHCQIHFKERVGCGEHTPLLRRDVRMKAGKKGNVRTVLTDKASPPLWTSIPSLPPAERLTAVLPLLQGNTIRSPAHRKLLRVHWAVDTEIRSPGFSCQSPDTALI